MAFGGTIGIVAYRAVLSDTAPAAVPDEAVETARDSVPSALAAAQELPDALGAGLIEAALAAFGRGLQVSAAVAAGVVTIAVVAVLALTRRSAVADEVASDEVEVPHARAER